MMEREQNAPFELPEDWKLPKSWASWALEQREGWTMTTVKACAKKFHKFQRDRHIARSSVEQWETVFKNWVQREHGDTRSQKSETSSQGAYCIMDGCKNFGTLTTNMGMGPWYCREHFSFKG